MTRASPQYHLTELAAAIAALEKENRQLRDEIEILRDTCAPADVARADDVLAERQWR